MMVGLGVYQGSRVMPSLAEAGKRLAARSESRQEAVALVSEMKKKRRVVTQTLCGLSISVFLLTAVGEIL
ncbi:hypothetical protein ACFLYR_08395 [Chloroflexota bacterium]